MAKFGKRSMENLKGVHPKIVDVLLEAIQHYDFTVLEGLRSSQKQAEYYALGTSKTLNSKHLRQSDGYSHAVDIAPWPIDWDNTEEFFYLAGLIEGIALNKGVKLQWGGRWRSLKDCPHFELKEE